jgi:glutamyl endopeptidase
MRLLPWLCLVPMTACALDESAPATDLELREVTHGYDPATRETTIDLDGTLAAIRRTDPPIPVAGTVADAPEASDPSSVVFGSDGRVQVTATGSFPGSARCRLALEFSDGYTSAGSGHVIGKKYIITAGHVMYSHDHNGWATKITAYCGQDGSTKPFGGTVATYMRTTQGWVDSEDDDVDYGLLTMDSNIGEQTGTFGYATFGDDYLDSAYAYVVGYPVDKAWGTQWSDGGYLTANSSDHVFYEIDTYGGDSGAGVVNHYNGGRYVFAVHTGSGYYWLSYYNQATRITNARFYQIQGWLASGY